MRGSVAKGRLQCQERAAFASGVGRTKTAFLEGLEGFGGFDGWQAASLNAKKKLLGWALVPLPAGLGLPKSIWRVWGVLQSLTAGKRQASTPRKSYWDGQWDLVPLPAGFGVQKCIWRVWSFCEGFGAFLLYFSLFAGYFSLFGFCTDLNTAARDNNDMVAPESEVCDNISASERAE